MRDWYEFLSHFGNAICTRYHLAHIKNGAFKDDIDTYVKLGLIEEIEKDKFIITEKGRAVLCDGIKMEDLLKTLKRGE